MNGRPALWRSTRPSPLSPQRALPLRPADGPVPLAHPNALPRARTPGRRGPGPAAAPHAEPPVPPVPAVLLQEGDDGR